MVMVVTDRARYESPDSLIAAAGRAARAGVDLIQVRERGLEDGDLVRLVRDMKQATKGSSCRTVVNDRVDVAVAADADGAHLPARAYAAASVRAWVGDGFLIGRSVHSEAEARSAVEAGGCDYLIFGTVFPSASKPDGHAPAGIDALRRVCASVPLPVLAIGGITVPRLPEVVAAGAAGIAAIGLFATPDEAALTDTVRSVRAAFSGR